MVRKWCNQKEISTPNTKVGKNLINNLVLILSKHKVSRMGNFSRIGGHSVTRTELKYENISTKVQHQNIKNKNHQRSIALERSVI